MCCQYSEAIRCIRSTSNAARYSDVLSHTANRITMKNYIVIYHAPATSLADSANQTPEQMEENMQPWQQWAEQLGDQLVDLGQPLVGGINIKEDGSNTPSSREVVGYSIVRAENMDEAISLMQDHPHLAWGGDCEIEVHETMSIPGS